MSDFPGGDDAHEILQQNIHTWCLHARLYKYIMVNTKKLCNFLVDQNFDLCFQSLACISNAVKIID